MTNTTSTTTTSDDDPITVGQFREYRFRTARRLKKIQDELADLWNRVNDVDEAETQIADEALEKAGRAQRAIRRLEKRVADLEQEES